MTDIFLYRSSQQILKNFIENLKVEEKKGVNQRIAKALGIFPSYLSLILNGNRTLNLDQGLLLADFMNLKKIERRYLYRVIELERAQSTRLKDEINLELDELIKKEHQISAKVERDQLNLNIDELVQFFSSWEYAVIHLIPALENGKISISAIAKRHGIEIRKVREIVQFLFRTGLWVKTNAGIELGKRKIHLGEESQLLNGHHANWRLKAVGRHSQMNRENELAYSLCVALSREDVMKIKSVMLTTIEKIRKISDPSDSQVIYNLNIDWLKVHD